MYEAAPEATKGGERHMRESHDANARPHGRHGRLGDCGGDVLALIARVRAARSRLSGPAADRLDDVETTRSRAFAEQVHGAEAGSDDRLRTEARGASEVAMGAGGARVRYQERGLGGYAMARQPCIEDVASTPLPGNEHQGHPDIPTRNARLAAGDAAGGDRLRTWRSCRMATRGETMPMYGDCYATEGEAYAALLAVWDAA